MTHYVFFAPLAHPKAITKAAYVLGSENKENAYNDVMSGKLDKIELKNITEKGKALAQEHLEIAKKIGIQGTPTFFINGQIVIGADTNKIESLLSPSKNKSNSIVQF